MPETMTETSPLTVVGNPFTDTNGAIVHAFSSEMGNLNQQRQAELLRYMLSSGAWRDFGDGAGRYTFLPGEFDYFLSQWGVDRKVVMAIDDYDLKAELEAAMDERRTGEEGYRRPIAQARAEIADRPGRPIEPYGATPGQADEMNRAEPRGTQGSPRTRRYALGPAVRRYTNTGRATTRSSVATLPLVERLRRQALWSLDDDDLHSLIGALTAERKRRQEGRPRHVCENCGKGFDGKRAIVRYCSDNCGQAANSRSRAASRS